DEFIKQKGADAFDRVLERAGGEIDYRIYEIISHFDLAVPDEKLSAISKVTDLIASFDTLAIREVYSARSAEILKVTPAAIREQAEKKHRIFISKRKKEFAEKEINKSYGYGDNVNKDRVKLPGYAIIEEKIIGILFIHPEYYADVKDKLNEDLFVTDFIKKVFRAFLPSFESGTEPVLSILEPAETGQVSKMVAERQGSGDHSLETLKVLIQKLKDHKVKADFDQQISGMSDDSQRAKALEEYIRVHKKEKKK
ncbi:MAG: hypothetical protein IJS94_06780, partial [Clostridia bacterium]|nr:hypothetical protein [Clostridia bacterium]